MLDVRRRRVRSEKDVKGVVLECGSRWFVEEECCGRTWLVSGLRVAIQRRLNLHLNVMASH